MIDYLESIDRAVVLFFNGLNTPFLDEVMWIISAKLTWIPLYVILIYLFARKNNLRRSMLFVLFAILVVAITDQSSVHLFKNMFLRYRPSHHALLTENLHFYQFDDGSFYKGGMYGFVSSHAANFFGVLTFAYFALRSNYKKIGWILFSISAIVCLSRIYLGVHYLSDVIAGGLLGVLVAWAINKFFFIPILDKDYFDK
jgi:undecaprenyl-diphosphatase